MKNKFLLILFLMIGFVQVANACVPTLTIQTSTGSTAICSASFVQFTSIATDPGTTPTYQWYKNGAPIVGANGATYSTAAVGMITGDAFYCEMTSNAACASPTLATSNIITMTVTIAATPSSAVTSLPNTTSVCAGASITFISVGNNLGSTPVRQWKINGNLVGTNSNTYVTNSLVNGDVITCEITSSLSCVTTNTALSSPITMTVNPSVLPDVIIASPNAVGCSGTPVINFTSTIVNGGSGPTYQWQVNGVNIATGDTFNSSSLLAGDVVRCILNSNAFCAVPKKDTSNTITVNVLPVVTPTITVTADANSVCASSTVNFTAAITNGGTTPHFQWQVNGALVGADTNWYAASYLNNNDTVKCILVSSEPCISATSVASYVIMSVTPAVTPTVTLVASPGNTICFGQPVTYTATVTNGGASPSFVWKVNGVPVVGNNSATYTFIPTASSLVGVILTSSAACVTASNASSSNLPLTVKPLLTPTITINTANTQVCYGTNINFTSAVTVAGFSPTYQWKVNGVNAGTNANSFNTSALAVGTNTITCTMTSSSNQCLTSALANSNQVIVTIDPLLVPDVTITSNLNNVCFGTPITFTATPTNGGFTPIYQWKKNGVNIGLNSPTMTTISLNNGDLVSCIMTTSVACYAKNKDTSNVLTMIIKPLVTPSLKIKSDTNKVCQYDMITFTAYNIVNGGANPILQWKVNGINVPATGITYASPYFNNGDIVTCQLTSTADCPSPMIVTSKPDTVVIYPPATPDITISSSDTDICIGTNVVFTSVRIDGGTNPNYQWFWNGLPYGPNSSTFSTTLLETNDSVYVVMFSNAHCLTKPNDTSNAITFNTTDNISPTITLTSYPQAGASGTPIIYTATTPVLPPYTIQWFRNNALATTTTTNTWATNIVNNTDSVYAKILNYTGCYLAPFATSKTIKLGALGIGQLTPANFVVYPNPVLNVAIVEGVEIGDEMILYDMTGKIIMKDMVPQQNTYQLNMSSLSSGLYQAKFIRGNQHWVVRLNKR